MKFSDNDKYQLVQRYQNGEPVAHICSETGIARSTFYSWIDSYHTTVTETGAIVTPQESTLLKRRVQKQKDIIKVLKSVNCTTSSPLSEKLTALEALQGRFSVHTLCDALEVSRGTFYNHILRNKRNNAWYIKRREEMSQRIKKIYDENRQVFGAEKIRAVLLSQDEHVSKKLSQS